MRNALWIIAVIGAAFGTVAFCEVFAEHGAAQQGAVAAVAVALAVIPYCLARSVSALLSNNREKLILIELREIRICLEAKPFAHDLGDEHGNAAAAAAKPEQAVEISN